MRRLDNSAGIDLKRISPGGDHGSAVTIRGFDESRCLILLDGRPLNAAGVYGGDYVDWSSLSTEDIERIEVIRGAKSAVYGNTLGGVVNIITRRLCKTMKSAVKIIVYVFAGVPFMLVRRVLSPLIEIKVGLLSAERIGHLLANTEYWMRNRSLQGGNKREINIFLPKGLKEMNNLKIFLIEKWYARKKTDADLAIELDCDPSLVSKWVCGAIEPTFERKLQISRVLGLDSRVVFPEEKKGE